MKGLFRIICFTLLVCHAYPLLLPASHAGDLSEAGGLHSEGLALIEEGKYREASERFGRMLQLCCEDDPCRASGLFYLGRCKLERGGYGEAVDLLEQAEKIFRRLNMRNQVAVVWLTRGRVGAAQSDYTEALRWFAQAEAVFKQAGNKREMIGLLLNRASAYVDISQYDKASADLAKAETLIERGEGGFSRADLWNAQALVACRRQNYNKAMELYEKALAKYRGAGNLKGVAIALNNIGHVHEVVSEYDAAREKYKGALRCARRIDDQKSVCTARNNIANTYFRQGNYTKASAEYRASLETADRLHARLLYAQTLNNLGSVYFASGDFPQAEECFKESLELSAGIGAPEAQAWALHNLANISKDMGRFKASLDYSFRALQLASKVGNRRLEATATLRLGNLEEYIGAFDKALDHYEKAAEIQSAIQDRLFRSNTLMDMAVILTREGKFAKAERLFNEAAITKRELGTPRVELLCKFALALLERPQYEGESVDEQSVTPERRPEDLAKARELIASAEKEVREGDGADGMMVAYMKARHLLETQPNESLGAYEKLHALAQRSQSSKYEFLAMVGLGLAYEKAKDLPRSEDAFAAAVQLVEEIRDTLDPASKRTFLHGEEILGVKHIMAYEGLARIQMKRGELAEALSSSELAKARSFAEHLSQTVEHGSFGVDKGLLESLERLERSLTVKQRQIEQAERAGTDTAYLADLRRSCEQLGERRAKLKERLKHEYPKYYMTRFPSATLLKDAGLSEKEWFIEYDVTDSGILIFLIRGETLVKGLFRPMSRSALNRLVRAFREPLETQGVESEAALMDKLRSFDLSVGKRLADILLGGVLESLPRGVHLTVIPDDSVGVLPFEMLVLNDSGRIADDKSFPYTVGVRFFGDRNPISYYQSITALALARRRQTVGPTEGKALVIADPVFSRSDPRVRTLTGSSKSQSDVRYQTMLMSALKDTSDGGFGLSALPLTSELAEYLSDLYGRKCDVYTGLDASKAVFLSRIAPRLDDYSTVVLATHGYFDRNNPVLREPVLFLSTMPEGEDAHIRMTEVMGLEMASEIVALTACQTGLGRHISGEGIMGMGRAFQYAGARSVLMSLWSVSEKATVRLIQRFFEHLKQGRPKAEALRLARLDIREAGYDHPFFWAAFVLAGEVR